MRFFGRVSLKGIEIHIAQSSLILGLPSSKLEHCTIYKRKLLKATCEFN